MKDINNIIYETTREITNVEDKLKIATIFLFCEKLGQEKLSELLYCNDYINFIENLNNEFANYKVDFSINFDNQNLKNSFYKTIEKVKEKEDKNGFLKAIYEKDNFALVILDIVNYEFNENDFKKSIKKIEKQLSLFDN